MFRRLIPVIQLIKQFIFIDSGINVFVMLRLALAAMATSVAAVSASTFHFSAIFFDFSVYANKVTTSSAIDRHKTAF